jgi:hypothetical protein
MDRPATIPELPKPSKRGLPLPILLLRLMTNPAEIWAEHFFEEPVVVYPMASFRLGRLTWRRFSW